MSTIGLVQLLYAALAVVMAGLGLSLRLSDFAGLRRHGSSECRYTKVVDKDACRRLSRTVVSSAPCLPPWPTSSRAGAGPEADARQRLLSSLPARAPCDPLRSSCAG